MAVRHEDSQVSTENKTQEDGGLSHMDATGASVPNISVQVSDRGSPVGIGITHRDRARLNAKDLWKLS